MRPKMSDIHKYHAHLLNVGLGIQSTAAALMCINDDLPRPNAFIFADPGWEREGTYENLERLMPLAHEAGIPFHVVSAGNIREQGLDPEIGRTELPFYCDPSRFETVDGKRELLKKDVRKTFHKHKRARKNQEHMFDEVSLDDMLEIALKDFDRKVEDGLIKDGYMEMPITMLGRQCTEKYKIAPANKYCRENYGAHFKTPVGTWLGISTDEWTRMASSREKAFLLFYPLIDYGMSRDDCEAYLRDHDYPVPVKSACIGCPYHSDEGWRDLTDAEIADAAAFEKGVNEMIKNDPKLSGKPYYANGIGLHPTMIDIEKRPFDKTSSTEESIRDAVCGSAGCFLTLPIIISTFNLLFQSFL